MNTVVYYRSSVELLLCVLNIMSEWEIGNTRVMTMTLFARTLARQGKLQHTRLHGMPYEKSKDYSPGFATSLRYRAISDLLNSHPTRVRSSLSLLTQSEACRDSEVSSSCCCVLASAHSYCYLISLECNIFLGRTLDLLFLFNR